MIEGSYVGSAPHDYRHDHSSSLEEICDRVKLFDKLMKRKAENLANGKLIARLNILGNLEYVLAKDR